MGREIDGPVDAPSHELESCDYEADEAAALTCRTLGMIGDWIGRVSLVNSPGYGVEVTFYDDGTYVLRCPAFGASGPGLCLEADGEETARTLPQATRRRRASEPASTPAP